MPEGNARDAVLYWFKDEGRTWYGWPYEQKDSTVRLRACEVILNGDFGGNKEGEPIELTSESGDFQVARLTSSGSIEPLSKPVQIPADRRCGVILVDGQPVGVEKLERGLRPVAVILCRNQTRPESYPAAAAYTFGPIVRTESDADRTAPSPCPGT